MVILLIITTTGCKKSYQVDKKIENKLFQFTEIGSKELLQNFLSNGEYILMKILFL